MKVKRTGFLVVALASILLGILFMFLGCRRGTVVQQPVQQPVVLDFKGEWVISNWTERGIPTFKHDGKTVNISEKNGLYEIDSPDWFFNYAKFRLSRNALVGNYVATFEDLTDMFTMPEEVLKQAAASRAVVYSGSLVMLRDGRLVADRSNCQITYSREGRFSHVTPFPGWIKFVLTKTKR